MNIGSIDQRSLSEPLAVIYGVEAFSIGSNVERRRMRTWDKMTPLMTIKPPMK